jgi:xanthine dehydrogenase YagS FAD-binding subunit
MRKFELARAGSVAQARELNAETPGSVFKAGGIDLLDHLKERLVAPPRLVDLKSIPGMREVAAGPDGSLRIGALATLAEVAAHAGVRKTHRALAEACGEAASPQIRNVATIGGNVLQRPRCWYYRLESYKCLKKGGDVCYAVGGENRYHAIFGGGPSYAPHPSNAAVALVALGASFVLEGEKGPRTVAAAEFFTPPSTDPERENQIKQGEVLTEIRVPAAPDVRSTYTDVRERQAFDWPLVSTAIAIKLDGGTVKEARVVLGAVAPVPWRSPKAEQALVGRPLDAATALGAARAATVGAAPLSDNGYKLALVQTLVRRTLMALA